MRILFWTEKIYCVWQFRGSFYSLGAMGGRSYKGQTSPICSFAANEIPAQISPEVLHEKGNSKYLDNNATKVLLELYFALKCPLCSSQISDTSCQLKAKKDFSWKQNFRTHCWRKRFSSKSVNYNNILLLILSHSDSLVYITIIIINIIITIITTTITITIIIITTTTSTIMILKRLLPNWELRSPLCRSSLRIHSSRWWGKASWWSR